MPKTRRRGDDFPFRLFVIPFVLGLLFMGTLFAVKVYTHRILPSVHGSDYPDDGAHSNGASVAFHPGRHDPAGSTNAHTPEHNPDDGDSAWNIHNDDEYSDYRHFDHGIFDNDKENLIISSSPYTLPPSWSPPRAIPPPTTPTSPREITVETVVITSALLVGLVVFIGPYGIFALVLDNGLRVLEDLDYLKHFWFFKVCFPWALAKPLFEPIVISAVMTVCRYEWVGRGCWRWWNGKDRGGNGGGGARRTWSEHAATARSGGGEHGQVAAADAAHHGLNGGGPEHPRF